MSIPSASCGEWSVVPNPAQTVAPDHCANTRSPHHLAVAVGYILCSERRTVNPYLHRLCLKRYRFEAAVPAGAGPKIDVTSSQLVPEFPGLSKRCWPAAWLPAVEPRARQQGSPGLSLDGLQKTLLSFPNTDR